MEASTTLNGESLGAAGAGVVLATFLVFACARAGRIRVDRQAAATAESMACFIGELRLECQTQGELNLPRTCSCILNAGGRNLAEDRAGGGHVGIVEVRMIEQVKDFRTELQETSFFPERKVLQKREV